MSENWNDWASDADTMIKDFGDKMKLVRLADDSIDWLYGVFVIEDTAGLSNSAPQDVVITNKTLFVTIPRRDAPLPGDDIVYQPTYKDKRTWSIISVDEIKPTNTVICYRLTVSS